MEKLIANNGMILTNGEAFGRVVFLGTGDSADNWYEITEAEYQAIMEESATDENTATEEDYQAALREMGVNV
jgi:hypothetical protein